MPDVPAFTDVVRLYVARNHLADLLKSSRHVAEATLPGLFVRATVDDRGTSRYVLCEVNAVTYVGVGYPVLIDEDFHISARFPPTLARSPPHLLVKDLSGSDPTQAEYAEWAAGCVVPYPPCKVQERLAALTEATTTARQAKALKATRNKSSGGGGGPEARPKVRPLSQALETAKGERHVALKATLGLVFEKYASYIFAGGPQHVCLTRLVECRDLAELGAAVDFDTAAFCDALCAVVRRTAGDPLAITLDHNNVRSGFLFLDALATHGLGQQLRSLSLASNVLSDVEPLLSKLAKLPALRSLDLSGNPAAGYHTVLKQRLPQLEVIDGGAVLPRPLDLPWPVAPQHSPDQGRFLTLARALLDELATAGPSAAFARYHVDATCSVSPLFGSTHVAGAPNLAQMVDPAADPDGRHEAWESAVGRAAVCALLERALYPRGCAVSHAVGPHPDVATILVPRPGMAPAAVAAVTLHGTMAWRIKPDQTCRLCFDRTVCFVAGPLLDAPWEVACDSVTLRPCPSNQLVVFDPAAEQRLGRLAAQHRCPVSRVAAAASMPGVRSDAALVQASNLPANPAQ